MLASGGAVVLDRQKRTQLYKVCVAPPVYIIVSKRLTSRTQRRCPSGYPPAVSRIGNGSTPSTGTDAREIKATSIWVSSLSTRPIRYNGPAPVASECVLV